MKKKKIYAIIDIETTGGRSARDKITEIAIILYDGEKIIDTWETLIDPERTIPYNITKITGINDEMVVGKPKFYEVAKKIVEMTKGTIFVAHNVNFDYGFIKDEFKRLGYTYTRRLLCTVRLAKKSLPGFPSYALGNLIKMLDINVKARHRAMADAKATQELLEIILKNEVSEEQIIDMINAGINESRLPKNISLEKLHELPEACGVYYFYNSEKEIIYVGKSLNIKKRVMNHFSKMTQKSEKIKQRVHDIGFEITGSELVALLFESHEIKKHLPSINRAQRRRYMNYVIFRYQNQEGYHCLDVTKASKKERESLDVIAEFPTQSSAKRNLAWACNEFLLCSVYCNIELVSKPCFKYHVEKCYGACIEEESADDYNYRVHEAAEQMGLSFDEDFILIDEGREKDERALVWVEDGQYIGFGYASLEDLNNDPEDLRDFISNYQHNPDTSKIIQHFLHRFKYQKKIVLHDHGKYGKQGSLEFSKKRKA